MSKPQAFMSILKDLEIKNQNILVVATTLLHYCILCIRSIILIFPILLIFLMIVLCRANKFSFVILMISFISLRNI